MVTDAEIKGLLGNIEIDGILDHGDETNIKYTVRTESGQKIFSDHQYVKSDVPVKDLMSLVSDHVIEVLRFRSGLLETFLALTVDHSELLDDPSSEYNCPECWDYHKIPSEKYQDKTGEYHCLRCEDGHIIINN